MRVGNMPLNAMNGEVAGYDPRRPFFTTSPTTSILDGSRPGSNRDAHYATLTLRRLLPTVVGTGFFIRGDQKCQSPRMLGCCATKRSAATTIAASEPSYLPHRVRITCHHEWWVQTAIDPTIGVARRHHVGMPGKGYVSPCPRHAQKFCVSAKSMR